MLAEITKKNLGKINEGIPERKQKGIQGEIAERIVQPEEIHKLISGEINKEAPGSISSLKEYRQKLTETEDKFLKKSSDKSLTNAHEKSERILKKSLK